MQTVHARVQVVVHGEIVHSPSLLPIRCVPPSSGTHFNAVHLDGWKATGIIATILQPGSNLTLNVCASVVAYAPGSTS